MTPKQLIEYFGSEVKVAAAVGVSQQAVRVWRKNESIPRITQLAIQTLTKNKLVADKEQ